MKQTRDGHRIAVCLGLVFALIPGVARAITLLEVQRSTLIRAVFFDPFLGEYTVTTTESDPLGRGYWSSSLSDGDPYPVTASQTSVLSLAPGAYTVGSTYADLSGTGGVSMSLTGHYAESIYHVLLTLDAPTEYAFAVDNLNPGYIASGSAPGGFVHFDRVDPGDPSSVLESIQSVEFCRIYFTGEGCPDVTDAGLLEPGTYAFDYELHYAGSHHANAPGTAGFSLFLTEIPEPGTLALVAVGLAGLAATCRRKTGERR